MAQILNDTYEVLELVGKGGMSAVFKARHIRLNTIVAVKSVRKDQAIDLAAEVNILTKLNHPNLVRVIDIFEDEKLIYIVMDYVEGEDLQHVIRREKVIPEGTVIEWFRTLAGVLRYLHTRKPPIIYRDMKPANVILQSDGTLKLIDFGIAREYKAAATGDTTYIGTNGFAAPEQFGLAQSDGRTDIYSLGMTMYYLATGKSPLEPPYGYTPARQLNPDISEKLEAILEKCIKANPEDRYQTDDELLQDLYDGETMPFPTGTAAFRTEPAATPWSAAPAPDTTVIGPETKPQPVKKTPAGLYAGIGAAALALIAGVVIMLGSRGSAAAADIPQEAVSEIAAEEAAAPAAEAEEAAKPESEQGQGSQSIPEEPVQQDEETETGDTEDDKGKAGSEGYRPEGTVRVGIACDYAPFEFPDESGNCTGMEPMMLESMMNNAGVDYVLVNMAYDELIPSLESGAVDMIMSAMVETEERKEAVDFSDPYYSEGITVIMAQGQGIGDDVNRLSGIRAASYSYDPMLEAFISKFNINNVDDIMYTEHVQDKYRMLDAEIQALVVRHSSLLDNSQITGTYPVMYLQGKDLFEKYGLIFRNDPDPRFAVRKGDEKMLGFVNGMIADLDEYLAEDCLQIAKEIYLGELGHW